MNIEKIIRPPMDIKEYGFLTENEHLGSNIVYLTISGSRAYGTNNENSDIDVRGVAIERPEEIYGNKVFEQFEDPTTDTVVFGLKKYVKLCCGCNPNVLEMLGTREEDILYTSDIGKILRDNVGLFLTKKAYATFAGYATMQLRRLENALAHDSYADSEKEKHILKSIESLMLNAKQEYEMEGGAFTCYIPEAEENAEICVDVKLDHIPLRRFLALRADLTNMLRNYAKLNKRNNKKDNNHLCKHAMHLIRLYLTGIDILENGQMVTYREKDLPILREIRNGNMPFTEVFHLAEEYRSHLQKAYECSRLPDTVDENKVNRLLVEIYSRVLSK